MPNYNCEPDNKCITSCGREIGLDIGCKPNIRCVQKSKPNCDFDIDIMFEVKPQCVDLKKCGETVIDCNKTCCHYKASLAFDVCPTVKYSQQSTPKCEFDFALDFACTPQCTIDGKDDKYNKPKYSNDDQCDCDECAGGNRNYNKRW